LWNYYLEDGKNAADVLFSNGSEKFAVEYDKFGKAKNEDDLVELNRLLSTNKKSGEEEGADGMKIDKKKKRKEKKKKKSEWGYDE